ncbi:MAG TPA: hypothetical protein VE439_00015 [Anaerolineae bacterium]|jgi:hypothetical protein|nr:hypothetical protein [Anaerolineae bacterium]
MELGYRLLAEALVREEQLDDVFEATIKLPEGDDKTRLLREIRNNAVKDGRLGLYQRASRMIGLDDKNPQDLAIMLYINIENQVLDRMLDIIDLLPENETKRNLITTAIVESVFRGHIILAEKLAEKRGRGLTREEAMIAKEVAVREGWITDAERAAKVAGVELGPEDYMTMFIANKDKGLLSEAREAAKRAGAELDQDSLTTLLLAAVRNKSATMWEIAEML